jgi:hypothetical protein
MMLFSMQELEIVEWPHDQYFHHYPLLKIKLMEANFHKKETSQIQVDIPPSLS